MAADKVLCCAGRPSIRDMLHVDLGHGLEKLHGEMVRYADTRGTVVELTRPGLHVRDEFLDGARLNRGVHGKRKGPVATSMTGAKLFTGSYGTLLTRLIFAVNGLLTIASTWPSGAARATDCVTTFPLAPGLFSMTTDWFQRC